MSDLDAENQYQREELVAHLRRTPGWPTLGNAAANQIERDGREINKMHILEQTIEELKRENKLLREAICAADELSYQASFLITGTTITDFDITAAIDDLVPLCRAYGELSRAISDEFTTCYHCGGSGMQLKGDGEPGLCNVCKGDTVVDKGHNDG